MSMNHDLTARLARDRQRQMLAEASHQQRHQLRRPARQTPRTGTRITRGDHQRTRVADLHVIARTLRWPVTAARKS